VRSISDSARSRREAKNHLSFIPAYILDCDSVGKNDAASALEGLKFHNSAGAEGPGTIVVYREPVELGMFARTADAETCSELLLITAL
jgi:hypothetical protein